MDSYFINITKTLSLTPYKSSNTMNINEIISAFDNHVSINKIKEYFLDASNTSFEFTEVSQDEVKEEAINKQLCSSNNSVTISIYIDYAAKNSESLDKFKNVRIYSLI